MDATIRFATEIPDQHFLEVKWDNDVKYSYPYIWLCDNCPCRKICWDASGTYLNYFVKASIDVEVKPVLIEVKNSENSVSIKWSDGHQSEYLSEWLLKYRLKETPDVDPIFSPNVLYWSAADIKSQVQKYDLQEILNKDEVLLKWMTDLRELGITFIVNAQATQKPLVSIGERVNFLQSSHHGIIWKIEARAGPSQRAPPFNADLLPLHTDTSYYQRPAGIMLLHCIKAAEEGGGSLFSDGFKVAEDLRRDHPEEFTLLTTTNFENFWDRTNEAHGQNHFRSKHPVIRLSADGKIDRIATAQHTRTPRLQIAPSKVLPVYRALKLFNEKLHEESNMYRYKLKEGEIVCLNNYRVLHGRDAFKVTKSGHRYLQGSYLDWDSVNSRARILLEKIGKKTLRFN